jgi:hypothetical protein
MSLVETLASLVLESLLLATLAASLVNAASICRAGEKLVHDAVRRRHLEHVLDHTFESAAIGRNRPAGVLRASPEELVLQADLNGDGRIDSRSAERSALELRSDGSGLRLVHRIGRQGVTVAVGLDATSRLRYLDAGARAATRAVDVRLVVVPTADGPLHFWIRPP